MRDIERIEAVLEKTIAFCDEHSIAYYLAFALSAKGYAMTQKGDLDGGIAEMREGMALFDASGPGLNIPHYQTLLAEAVIAHGDLDGAGALLDEADEPWERWGEGHYRAETIRVRGDLHRCLGDDNAGEASYRAAIAFAQGQEAKLFELRASISLARLWRERGKAREAHDLLAPVHDWFTEGFDTADLKDAKALLEELK
jgi:predicted ATPase